MNPPEWDAGRDRVGIDSGDEARAAAPAADAGERPRVLFEPRPPEPAHRALLLARRRQGATTRPQ